MPLPLWAAGGKILAADLVEDGQQINLTSERYVGILKELQTRYHFSREELDRLFAGVAIQKRVLELMDTQAEAKPYYDYFPRFITDEVVREGREKIKQYREVLDKIEAQMGVEKEIVVAIWGIETRYGKYKGGFNMFRTLNTMFDAYPRRRNFYRQQLIEFLLLCRDNKIDPLSVTGSYGGAFGQTQFIPSSFREYAVDFDGDGRRDVWNSVPDILASIANYLRRYAWVYQAPIYGELGNHLNEESLLAAARQGLQTLLPLKKVKDVQKVDLKPSPGDKGVVVVELELDDHGGMRYVAGYPNFQAITKWNNSKRYAMAVTELAARY
ncbi:MAG: lytic transglycosylase [Deltaproteobacteria bacterium RIFOXYD12_FULL_50_9]|nr:MAG: lytic transglycosylase [Deltaproteobacteria bacterium RIFOXYD12_FULL_50_9]